MKGIWLTLTALFTLPAFGQNLNFIHYNSNNSRLPHDVVYSVFQSSEGYLWICTDDGMVRFDGLQMKPYEKGLLSRYTIAVSEEKNQLWLATWKGGLHRLNHDSLIPVKSDLARVWNTNRLIVHQDIIIVFSFTDYSFMRLDPATGKLVPATLKGLGSDASVFSPANPDYFRFLKRRNGELFAYNKGEVREIKNGEIKKVTATGWNLLTESTDGRLYGLRGNEVLELNEDLQIIRSFYQISDKLLKPENIYYLYVLASGTICLGTEPLEGKTSHLMIYPQTGHFIDLVAGVKTNSPISSLFTDREGSIWLCTDGDGLYHVFDSRFPVIGNDILTINPNVMDVGFDPLQKQLVVGTRKGVFALDYPVTRGSKLNILVAKFFTNRLFTGEEGIGFCGKGLTMNKSYSYSKNRVHDLPFYELHTTLGYRIEVNYSFLGYRIYSRAQKTYYQPKKEDQPPSSLTDVSEDDKGRLWLASEQELYLFDWNTGWKKIPGWNGDLISSLLFETGRGLWIGTANGLYLFSEQGVLGQWTEKEGLHNSHVNCLYLQKDKGLWIGTQNGLYLLDTNNTLSLFKKRNGLIADDVLCFASLPEGYLAVGSSKGLTLLYPDVQAQRQEQPKLLLDDIRIDGLLSDPKAGKFEVKYNGTFEMNVNAITFFYPELLVFEYRLNPSDPWISTKNRSILLTRLKPGTYHIALRVRKPDAGYSEPLTLTLRVSQPWWKTDLFYVSIAVLLVGATAYFFYARLAKQRKALRLKKQLADLKLKSVLTQLNPHFVSNSLNAIQYYILNRDERQANHYLSKFASLTRLVLESSRHRFIPLQAEIEILELYLSLEKLRYENRFEFSIYVDKALSEKAHYLPGIIVQPFAENSINHGLLYLDQATKGQLDMSFLSEGDHLLIRIDDNGIGRKKSEEIEEKQAQKRTSLSGSIVEEIRQSVNELPGCSMEVRIIDKEDTLGEALGTCVEIRLKISEAVAGEEQNTKSIK